MSRPIFVSNGSMMVGLDKYGFVHDFYYPYVGLENHASSRDLHHRIGVWVDGDFTWLDDGTWNISLTYEPDGLIGLTRAVCSSRQLALEFHDFVDSELNVFARNIHIVNNAKQNREIRLFLHQVFRISDSNRDDTAVYIPDQHVLMHYNGRRIFTIYGEFADSFDPFDQYSIGLHGIEGFEGTYKDAEDGELGGHPVEHGKLDSTIRFSAVIGGLSSKRVHYWVAAGTTREAVFANHQEFIKDKFQKRYHDTQQSWREWLAISANSLHRIDRRYQTAVKQSLLIIKSHIDRRGAVIASGDSEMLNYARDYYSYCWPRDAAYALWPLMRLGHFDEARKWFEFARDVLSREGYLMHKYQPDRSVGSSWHPYLHDGVEELPVQEDETAITIFLLKKYLDMSKDEDFVRTIYPTLVHPAANFLDSYIDSETKLPHASYDLWEENFLTTTYTTGVVYAALVAAAELAEMFEFPDDAIRWRTVADDIKRSARETLFAHDRQYFLKGFHLGKNGMMERDTTIDASALYGAAMFGLYDIDDEYVDTAARTLESTLYKRSPAGGMPRYENDRYHSDSPSSLGNPWFVTTLWFAQFQLERGQADYAHDALDWTMQHMSKSGVLPEQIDPKTGKHVSVEPLIWSQAEFINTVLDLDKS